MGNPKNCNLWSVFCRKSGATIQNVFHSTSAPYFDVILKNILILFLPFLHLSISFNVRMNLTIEIKYFILGNVINFSLTLSMKCISKCNLPRFYSLSVGFSFAQFRLKIDESAEHRLSAMMHENKLAKHLARQCISIICNHLFIFLLLYSVAGSLELNLLHFDTKCQFGFEWWTLCQSCFNNYFYSVALTEFPGNVIDNRYFIYFFFFRSQVSFHIISNVWRCIKSNVLVLQ